MNLVSQELVNGLSCFCVGRADAHHPTVWPVLIGKAQSVLSGSHRRDSGRHFSMRHERLRKIALRTIGRNLPQVRSNLIAPLSVRWVSGDDLYAASGFKEPKMMRRAVLVEPHRSRAASRICRNPAISGGRPCHDVRAAAQRMLIAVDTQIADLMSTRKRCSTRCGSGIAPCSARPRINRLGCWSA